MATLQKNKKFVFYFEITTACNLKCPFCPSSKKEHHKHLEFNNIINILNKIKDYSELIYFHVLGEPTLHPDFFKVLDFCEKEQIYFGLTTNGTTISKIYIKLLEYKYLKKVNISLQCLVNFNEVRIDEYLNNILKFLDYKENNRIATPVNLRLWNDKKKSFLFNQRIVQKLSNITTIKNVRFSEDDEFVWPEDEKGINLVNTKCLGGKKQLGILNDGSVIICCLDSMGKTCIGNIYHNTIDEILNSKLYLDVIKGFNDKKPYFDICKKCTYRNRFM